MLNFIIGRKNSGKTTAAHLLLGRCVKNGENPLLIVPKQNTFDSDRSILSLLGPKDACEVQVLSFTRLCHVVLQNYGGITKPIAKQTSRLIYMSLAIESLCDKLIFFAKHREDISLVTRLLSFVDEMKNEGITADKLEECSEGISDNKLREKIRECALIYRTYDAMISQSNFDDADLLSRVHQILCSESFFCGKTIVIDGFAHFSSDEIKLITLMMKQAKNVYVCLCIDSLSEPKLTGPFVYTGETARKLMLAAGNNGISVGEALVCSYGESYFKQDISMIEKNLYNPCFKPYSDKSENLTVITAPSFYEECDAVARKIKALIRTGEYRCRDIAVVYRENEKYEKQLRLSFKKYGVPFFEDKRQETVNQPLMCFVRNLIYILSRGFDSDYIFRLIKTGLTPISVQECACTENYAFMWDINGKNWLSPWKYNPAGFGVSMNEKLEKELAELECLRKIIVEPIIALKEKFDRATGKDKVRYLYEYLRENEVDKRLKDYAVNLENDGFIELALEQEQVWEILMEAFDDIALVLDGRTVTAKRFCEIFELVIREKTLGKLPDGYDEVSVCSAERMVTKRARVVFAVGLVQGEFPKTHSEDGLFSGFEKNKAEKSGLSFGNDIKQRSLRERFLLYNTLSAASDKLYLSYSVSSLTGEKNAKSEGLTWCEKILPVHEKITVGEEDFIDLIESEKSAFEILAKKYREQTKESDSLYSFFASRADYKAKLDSMGRAVAKEPYSFEDKDKAIKLFGENIYLSASRAEAYAKCPFMYFCRYGLKANPRIQAKLDAAKSGTVVHDVLEKILTKYSGRQFLELSDAQMKEEIEACLKQYMSENMVGAEEKDARFKYIYSRMNKVLSAIVERLCSEFGDSDYEPIAFEFEIKEGSDASPCVIPLEKGTVRFFGTVDRIDKMDLDGQRYIRVVDYKTGTKVFELSEVLEGLNMQMLLYLISIWRTGKGEYENIIPTAVLYFPAQMGAVTIEKRKTDSIERKEKRFSSHKMSGMIIGDAETARHMEKGEKGLYIPVTVDKRTGKIKGKFIDLETMKKLGEKTDEIIKSMGEGLHSGNVEARPVEGSSYSDICRYCNYSDVCLEENPEKRYIKKIPHEECFEIISGKEDKQ